MLGYEVLLLQSAAIPAADVLDYLFPSGATYFDSQMQEAAMSRLYGGIHYRSDIEVGMQHGKRVGEYTLQFARTDGADSK